VVVHGHADPRADRRHQGAQVLALESFHIPHLAVKALLQPPEILVTISRIEVGSCHAAQIKSQPCGGIPEPGIQFCLDLQELVLSAVAPESQPGDGPLRGNSVSSGRAIDTNAVIKLE